MHGGSTEDKVEPEERLGQKLHTDLTGDIAWQWLSVSSPFLCAACNVHHMCARDSGRSHQHLQWFPRVILEENSGYRRIITFF